ncbi:MAG: glycosyltransferase family 4 protein [Patescibacteria group bacterium]|nr:glycosyltransferase family 4 protein [Patescibacteria group bacterium]
MKIAQLVSGMHPVFPSSNVAIYSHVGWLINGLKEMSHRVSLYGAGDSDIDCELVSAYPTALTSDEDLSENLQKYYTNLLISKCYQDAAKFDIIHSHFTLLSAFFAPLVSTPTIHSVHSPISAKTQPILEALPDNYYVSFSWAQRQQMPSLNWIANIYHGVDTNQFEFNDKPDDYFLYLGRITEEKGVHLAIEAAKKAGVPLVLAGHSYPNEGYWHKKIEKYIDGKNVKYVGETNFYEKIQYLRKAKGLLFPTQYPEVFGCVMIEAMSCGTPVIAWKNGSVPEVIADGRSGYVVESVDEMTKAINAVDKLSRRNTRYRAEALFSVEKMVSGYAKVYDRVIEEHEAQ